MAALFCCTLEGLTGHIRFGSKHYMHGKEYGHAQIPLQFNPCELQFIA